MFTKYSELSVNDFLKCKKNALQHIELLVVHFGTELNQSMHDKQYLNNLARYPEYCFVVLTLNDSWQLAMYVAQSEQGFQIDSRMCAGFC